MENEEVQLMDVIPRPIVATPGPSQPSDPRLLKKDDVGRLISVGDCRVSFKAKEGKRVKSDLWQNFNLVELNGVMLDFAKCLKCKHLVSYSTVKGNSGLLRHSCGATKPQTAVSDTKQLKVDQFLSKATIVPSSAIDAFNDVIVTGLARDLRPISSVQQPGFLSIIQAALDLGAKYGKQDATKLIKSRTTLKNRNLPRIAQALKDKVTTAVLGVPHSPKYSFTTDMWSDKGQQRPFLSVNIHFTSAEFKKKVCMLAVEELPFEEKTAENVKAATEQIIVPYFEQSKFERVVGESVFVTDGGSNMVNTFPNYSPCRCHMLNLLLKWTFYNPKPPKSKTNKNVAPQPGRTQRRQLTTYKKFRLPAKCPRIHASIEASKALSKYFKKSGLNTQLKISFKQEVVTRWNCQLTMLESIIASISEAKQLLVQRNRIDKLIDFLIVFRDCSEAFQADESPTIGTVALWAQTLWRHIEVSVDDSDEMKVLKGQAKLCYKEYFKLTRLEYAAMLNPRYKSLKFAEPSVRDEAVAYLKNLLEGLERSTPTNELHRNVVPQTTEPREPSKKRPRVDFRDIENDLEDVDTNEVDIYAKQQFNNELIPKDKDILQFWCGARGFPKLRTIASWILSIPASQASDERVFSTTGVILTPRRTQLSGSTLSDLTYIHKNFNLLNS